MPTSAPPTAASAPNFIAPAHALDDRAASAPRSLPPLDAPRMPMPPSTQQAGSSRHQAESQLVRMISRARLSQQQWSCPFALNGGPCQRPRASDPTQVRDQSRHPLTSADPAPPGHCRLLPPLRSARLLPAHRPSRPRKPSMRRSSSSCAGSNAMPGQLRRELCVGSRPVAHSDGAVTRSNNLTSHLNRPRQTACRVAACRTGRWRQCDKCGRVLDGQVGLAKHKVRTAGRRSR